MEFTYNQPITAEDKFVLDKIDLGADSYDDVNLNANNTPINHRLWKSFMDVAIALTALVFLFPAFVMISAAILIADGGPIFFRQNRIGRNGEYFPCLKFRTMYKDADDRLVNLLEDSEARRAEWNSTRKLRVDPRVYPVGRILRKSSLDELPQIINVLKRQMSIVGPRPIVGEEVDRYGVFFGHYVSVRPGITGLWQVNGRNSLTYKERVALDVAYVEGISPLKDCMIIAKTAGIVLLGKGDH